VNNIATTFGGYWQEGDRDQVQSWANNSDLVGSVSFQPRRVPKVSTIVTKLVWLTFLI
jgi:hypothetical protein